jgi:hypothetical protein
MKTSQTLGGGRAKFAALLGALSMLATPAIAAPDAGKKACAKEARTLCPAEMKAMSRKRVEACMIAKVEQTSPTCKAAMYRIKAEREGKGS